MNQTIVTDQLSHSYQFQTNKSNVNLIATIIEGAGFNIAFRKVGKYAADKNKVYLGCHLDDRIHDVSKIGQALAQMGFGTTRIKDRVYRVHTDIVRPLSRH
jgi:hypothetical protein